MTACGSVCVRVKCSLTLSTCLLNELELQQNVRQDRKFQAQRDLQSLCKMHRCVELWSIECDERDKVRDTDSDLCTSNEKAIAVLARRHSEILERCGKLFSFH